MNRKPRSFLDLPKYQNRSYSEASSGRIRSFMDLPKYKNRSYREAGSSEVRSFPDSSKQDSSDNGHSNEEQNHKEEVATGQSQGYHKIEDFYSLNRTDETPLKGEDSFDRVYSNQGEIERNFNKIEQMVKLKQHSVTPISKLVHLAKSFFSRSYREETADRMIDRELEIYANYRDAAKIKESKLEADLSNIDSKFQILENRYSELRVGRVSLKKDLAQTQDNLAYSKTALLDQMNSEERDKWEKQNRSLEKHESDARSELEVINHSMLKLYESLESLKTNREETQRAYVSIAKIHITISTEINEVSNLKRYYLDIVRTRESVKGVWEEFGRRVSQRRIMNAQMHNSLGGLLEDSSWGSKIDKIEIRQRAESKDLDSRLDSPFESNSKRLDDYISEITGDY